MAKGHLWHGWVNLEEIDIDPSGFVFYGGYRQRAERGELPKFKPYIRHRRKKDDTKQKDKTQCKKQS